MGARWLSASLGLCGALAAAGCAKTADEWLEGIEGDPAVGLDAGPRFDAGARALPSAQFKARTAVSDVVEPRGLAVHRGTAYTTDRADDTLVTFDPASGAAGQRWPLPERGSPALAWHDGALLLGFEGAIYRFDGEAFTLVEATVAGLEGLADEDDGSLVTAEDGALYRRDGERLAPRLELRMSEAPAPLVRWGSDFLMAAGFDRPDGQVFAAELAVLDATSASGAVTRGVIAIPVDATVIAGLSAGPEGVYVLGAGYGTDVRHLITLEVR